MAAPYLPRSTFSARKTLDEALGRLETDDAFAALRPVGAQEDQRRNTLDLPFLAEGLDAGLVAPRQVGLQEDQPFPASTTAASVNVLWSSSLQGRHQSAAKSIRTGFPAAAFSAASEYGVKTRAEARRSGIAKSAPAAMRPTARPMRTHRNQARSLPDFSRTRSQSAPARSGAARLSS